MKERILEIGPYSAVGGVSVHIKRLAILLSEQFDISFIDESPRSRERQSVFNLRSLNVVTYFRLIKRTDIVHIHTGFWWLRCLHVFNSRLCRKKIVVTLHSHVGMRSSLSRIITRHVLDSVSRVIAVNEEIVNRLGLREVVVAPAFVPPDLATEQELPAEIASLLQIVSGYKLIVSNAFRLKLHDGQDLYGLDLLIEVARKIKAEDKPYRIIFVVASKNEKSNLMAQYTSMVEEEDLGNIISIVNYPVSFVRLVAASNLVVRATNTDGDALTIREALYLNRSVVASDVISRPPGTVLFRNRDAHDLYRKIEEVLDTGGDPFDKVADEVPKDGAYYEQYFLSLLKD